MRGPLLFDFTHPAYGAFACSPGSSLTLERAGSAFTASGSCSGSNIYTWRFSLEGSIEGETLSLDTLEIQADHWGCAAHEPTGFSGALGATTGSIQLEFTTDYTPCGQAILWDGTLSVALEAVE